jgi:5-methylcytosine-specific restriction protein A
MPHSAPKPCSKGGTTGTCNGLVRNGVCSVCGSQRTHNDRAYDKGRGTAHERGYDATWRKVRLMQLSEYPLCFDCNAQGYVVVATEVHHKRAIRDGGSNSFDNLMSLCKPCHSKRTNAGQ